MAVKDNISNALNKAKLLWTNPSPNSSQSSFTISDVEEFSHYIVYARYSTFYGYTFCECNKKSEIFTRDPGNIPAYARPIYIRVNDNNVRVMNCYNMGNASVDNDGSIILKIWGINLDLES